MATSGAVAIPFVFFGTPSGHDFEFHVNSWMEILSQWKQGIIYPAWAGLAHYGYGEARFIFYPPISWSMGAALGAILPWPLVPTAYICIALALSGCSMFLLARTWLDPNDSVFAAASYAANPYYLVIIYWRSAFAELLVGALLPLLLLVIWRSTKGRGEILPLAWIVAAAWLTNIPAAVMLTYSLALLTIIFAIRNRSLRVTADVGLAVGLGGALAAFYLFPALYEQKWINIAEVLAPGVRPQDNFLFTVINDSDHNRFNFLVSIVALAEIGVLAAALIYSRKIKVKREWWLYVAVWAASSTMLMFPFTSLAWKYFPELKFVQLPWRWLLCLNVPLALLVAVAWRRWLPRLIVCAIFLCVLVLVWRRVQPPWWDAAADITKMQTEQQNGHGYEGTDEYVPAGGDGYDVPPDAPLVGGKDSADITIQILQWKTESKLFTANASAPAVLYLRLFNYPAWKIEVNDSEVSSGTDDDTGQMTIPVAAGQNEVSITFAKTWDRKVGMLISAFTLLLVFIFSASRFRKPKSEKLPV
jgi:hypothetical protein